MELVIATVCIGGMYLLKNKENFTSIEDTIDKLNKKPINQFPVQNTDIMRNAIQTVPAFPRGVDYSTGPLKTPLENRLNNNKKPLDELLDMNKRSMNDFLNNNFIPNRNADTQNMNGTGVRNGNFIADDYNMGGDPGHLMSRMDTGFGPGSDPNYMNKRASGPRFSPHESATQIYGSPDIRPDLDRFRQDISRNRNKESPVEKVFYVGPGVGLRPDISASGGFNAGLNNRIVPNNIFAYKINQLEGRVISGKVSNDLPTALPGVGEDINGDIYGVPNNKKVPTFWVQDKPTTPYGISAIEANIMPGRIRVSQNNKINGGFGTLIPKK